MKYREGDILTYFGKTTSDYTKYKKYTIKKVEVHKGYYLVFEYFEVVNDNGSSGWHQYGNTSFNDLRDVRKEKLKKLYEI